jgi:RNA polymerase sigma factor (sigma-70 family)
LNIASYILPPKATIRMAYMVKQDIVEELKHSDIDRPVRQLYKEYYNGVVSQIRINGGSEDDGADVFQEAILVLIDKVKTGQFRGESSVKTFLSSIARNLWLYELRTRSRRNAREVVYANEANDKEESLHSVFHGIDINRMEKVIEQVGDVCKKILIGFYYEDKSMKELLVEFNYENEQVLRNRKSKCMKKLKELLTTHKDLSESLKTFSVYER